MSDDPKVVAMPGVARQSAAGRSADQVLASCHNRYTRVVVIGLLPDGSVELNTHTTAENANWMIDRGKRVIME